jgi:hypothetical protein
MKFSEIELKFYSNHAKIVKVNSTVILRKITKHTEELKRKAPNQILNQPKNEKKK